MAATYKCKACEAELKVSSMELYPPDMYFEAGNKDSLSFSSIDSSSFTFQKEDKLKPFFETLNYWGIHRNRTKILCLSCSHLLGHIYHDGPPLTIGAATGQFHMGPSQVIPRAPRYRFNTNSLLITSDYSS